MDRISDREPSRVIVLMACLWFPISLALINGHWLLSVFFLVGIWFFPVYFWKVKEVYFSEQAIKVKRGKGFVEIPLSKIQSVKHNPQFFRGCYKVVFKDRSPLGRYILFSGRSVRGLIFSRKHPGFRAFLDAINTSTGKERH